MGAARELRASDLRAVLDGVNDLIELAREGSLPEAMLRVVGRLVPCDGVSYNEVDLATAHGATFTDPRDYALPDAQQIFLSCASQNPLVVHQAGGDPTARRLSDFITRRELHSRPIYHLLYRPMEVEYQLAVGIGQPGEPVIGIALNRARLDFDAREAALLNAFARAATRIRTLTAPVRSRSVIFDGGAGPLTTRQREVLELVARGLTNAEVARGLVMSEHTVAKHLENAYRRLGVTNRTAALARLSTAPVRSPKDTQNC